MHYLMTHADTLVHKTMIPVKPTASTDVENGQQTASAKGLGSKCYRFLIKFGLLVGGLLILGFALLNYVHQSESTLLMRGVQTDAFKSKDKALDTPDRSILSVPINSPLQRVLCLLKRHKISMMAITLVLVVILVVILAIKLSQPAEEMIVEPVPHPTLPRVVTDSTTKSEEHTNGLDCKSDFLSGSLNLGMVIVSATVGAILLLAICGRIVYRRINSSDNVTSSTEEELRSYDISNRFEYVETATPINENVGTFTEPTKVTESTELNKPGEPTKATEPVILDKSAESSKSTKSTQVKAPSLESDDNRKDEVVAKIILSYVWFSEVRPSRSINAVEKHMFSRLSDRYVLHEDGTIYSTFTFPNEFYDLRRYNEIFVSLSGPPDFFSMLKGTSSSKYFVLRAKDADGKYIRYAYNELPSKFELVAIPLDVNYLLSKDMDYLKELQMFVGSLQSDESKWSLKNIDKALGPMK